MNIIIFCTLFILYTGSQAGRQRHRTRGKSYGPAEFLKNEASHFSVYDDPKQLQSVVALSQFIDDKIKKKYGHSIVLHDETSNFDSRSEEKDVTVKIADGQPGIPLSMTKYIYEGDIILTPKQAKEKLDYLKRKKGRSVKGSRPKRKMYRYKGSWWRNFPIQYSYNYDVFVGRAEGKQGISVGNGCAKLGTLTHEIGHSLGLWHEQSRTDADCCISIQKRNVIKAAIGNFLSQPSSQIITYNIPYDLGSVMHYGPSAFSKSWQATTIKTDLPGYQHTIGQRVLPSFYDVAVINTHYCLDKCLGRADSAVCERGGYPHPNNCQKCICPEGLGGSSCERNSETERNCGGMIHLGEQQESLDIASPGYPFPGFPTSAKCSWLIMAPENTYIQIRFYQDFSFRCSNTCIDYVEVKNSTDFGITGMRFCCTRRPDSLLSASNEMIVIFNSDANPDKGFKAQVRIRRQEHLLDESKIAGGAENPKRRKHTVSVQSDSKNKESQKLIGNDWSREKRRRDKMDSSEREALEEFEDALDDLEIINAMATLDNIKSSSAT